MTDSLENPQLDPLPQPKPVFTGFFARLGSFLIDCLLLFFVVYMLDKTMRPQLLQLNPWLPWLFHLLPFAYFFISTGPLGKGHTFGQTLLNQQVVDMQGNIPGWGMAFRRALAQQAFFVFFIDAQAYTISFPIHWRFPLTLALIVICVACLTFTLITAMTIATHPRKRGWHDLFAGTSLVNYPPRHFMVTEALTTPLDLISERRAKIYPKVAFFFWIIATIALLFQPFNFYSLPETKFLMEKLKQIARHEPEINPYVIAEIEFPNTSTRDKFYRHADLLRADLRKRGQDAPDTDTLRRQLIYDGESIVIKGTKRTGAIQESDFQDAQRMAGFNAIRAQLYQDWLAKSAQTPPGEEVLPAKRFVALFFDSNPLLFEPFAFFLYSNHRTTLRGLLTGPADPAGGPLVYQEYVPPVPTPAATPAPPHDAVAPTTGTRTHDRSTTPVSSTQPPSEGRNAGTP